MDRKWFPGNGQRMASPDCIYLDILTRNAMVLKWNPYYISVVRSRMVNAMEKKYQRELLLESLSRTKTELSNYQQLTIKGRPSFGEKNFFYENVSQGVGGGGLNSFSFEIVVLVVQSIRTIVFFQIHFIEADVGVCRQIVPMPLSQTYQTMNNPTKNCDVTLDWTTIGLSRLARYWTFSCSHLKRSQRLYRSHILDYYFYALNPSRLTHIILAAWHHVACRVYGDSTNIFVQYVTLHVWYTCYG